MLEVIEKLLILQDRDRKLRRVQSELAHVEPERQNFKGKTAAAQVQLESAKTRVRQIESDRKRLREQHFMRCPKCGHEMKEETLESVTIDRCSFCEGIFFDAGELDQVLLKREDDRRGFFRKLVKI